MNLIKLIAILSLSLVSLKSSDIVYGSIEENYSGGRNEYLKVIGQCNYPVELRKDKIIGNVYFQVTIDTLGQVKDVEFWHSPVCWMETEVERVIMLTDGNWIPKIVDNQKVDFVITDKVYFELR